jgi:hypothetical protein
MTTAAVNESSSTTESKFCKCTHHKNQHIVGRYKGQGPILHHCKATDESILVTRSYWRPEPVFHLKCQCGGFEPYRRELVNQDG